MEPLKRVFVTGVGALNACGDTVNESWQAVLQGQSRISPMPDPQLAGWPFALAGQIQSYDPKRMLPDRKLLKAVSRQDVLGIYAGMQALEDSQLLSYQASLNDQALFQHQTGVYVGSPGNKYYQQYDFLPLIAQTSGDLQAFGEQFMNEVHPMWLLRILPNNVLAYVGIQCGFKGVNHNVVNHATGGMQALLEAYHAIQAGDAERIVVIAYDVGTDEQALFYYAQLGLLSSRSLNPFDVSHDGTVLAEGAAALVLESEASVHARGVSPYAEITGGMARTECSGLFSIDQSGAAFAALIDDTLEQQHLEAHDLACIVAHGNGNPKSDVSEANALMRAGLNEIPLTSFKWAMGHTLCASGLMDAVLLTCVLRGNVLPGICPYREAAIGCESLNIAAQHRAIDKIASPYALLLNRGFGGMNTTLVMKACE